MELGGIALLGVEVRKPAREEVGRDVGKLRVLVDVFVELEVTIN